MTKIQSTPQSSITTPLVSTPPEPKESLSTTPDQGQVTQTPNKQSENLLQSTESGRQATQANPETSKLTGSEGVTNTNAPAPTTTVKPQDPVEKATKTPATPFEEIPAKKLTNDEARTELLALEKTGKIDVEFTDEGKTRLFVPMFNVNYKKETEKSEEKPIKSFLFSKAQDALKISRLSEWASLKGIKEIIFGGFYKKDKATDSKDAPPTSETTSPPPSTQPTETKPAEVKPAPVETKSAPPVETPVATPAVQEKKEPVTAGVPKPQTPAPEQTTPQTIPLSRLQTGGIPSSTSAVPLKKPGENSGVAKPSSPPPSMTATRLAFSQTKSQRDAQPLTARRSTPLTQEATQPVATQTGTQVQEPTNEIPTTATQKPTNLEASLRSQVAPTTQEAPTATQTITTVPAEETQPKSTLSSLGSRLNSLLKKPSTSRTSALQSLGSKLSDLFKDRKDTSLWNMNIKGYRGADPQTGKVIDVHGNRDAIRFNHYNFLDSVRTNRAQVAQEAQQQQELQREHQAAAQRAEEQSQLRTLLELEQMRRLDSVAPAPVQTEQVEEVTSHRVENVGDQQQMNVMDVHTLRMQHQWDDSLTKK